VLQAYITASTAINANKDTKIPWGKLLSRVEVWAIIVCHFCHNWGTFILLTWMPTYYNQVGQKLGCSHGHTAMGCGSMASHLLRETGFGGVELYPPPQSIRVL
jgi:hypothetical protein